MRFLLVNWLLSSLVYQVYTLEEWNGPKCGVSTHQSIWLQQSNVDEAEEILLGWVH
jgi:hypothetical protein